MTLNVAVVLKRWLDRSKDLKKEIKIENSKLKLKSKKKYKSKLK